jgi:hypothetical protein
LWGLWKIDIDKYWSFSFQKFLNSSLNMLRYGFEIWLFPIQVQAECCGLDAKQSGLLSSRYCARVPNIMTQVAAQIDPREDQIGSSPMVKP